MNVVKSASKSDIESASNVFESAGAGMYTLIKSRNVYGMYVGRTYDRTTAVAFASLNKGTIIIEGGYEMSNESATPNQRTITLVTIPQDTAQLLDNMRIAQYTDAEIIQCSKEGGGIAVYGHILRSIPFETLLSALVNGYLVEKSAEELETQRTHDAIRAEFTKCISGSDYSAGLAEGIAYTLTTLGLTITEVNA